MLASLPPCSDRHHVGLGLAAHGVGNAPADHVIGLAQRIGGKMRVALRRGRLGVNTRRTSTPALEVPSALIPLGKFRIWWGSCFARNLTPTEK